MKFVVLFVALATQCVLVKSRNGYGYSDETLGVLEYITYLKRLSLIVLMLGAVILYYVPKLRSHARKASCLLIDLVANVLKFALNATETKCEYGEYQTIEQDDQNETEPRIQELYRNVCEEYITKHGERCVEKCFDDGEWIENHERKRSHVKYNSQEKFKRHRQRASTHQHNEDAVIKELKSPTTIIQDSDLQPLTSRKQELNLRSIDVSNNLSHQRRIDKTRVENKKVKNMKIPSSSQCQLENHYAVEIMNKKIADSRDGNSHLAYQKIAVTYDNLEELDGIVTERELHDRLQRESSRFLNNMENMIDNCYEDILITKNRARPTLLRVANWFFGGCPEASRRIQRQAEKVGKEEISKSTNA